MSIATHIEVYTDGGFDAMHDAIGSWAFLVRLPGQDVGNCEYQHGGLKYTTNNRMEMLAVIKALEHVEMGPRTIVTSDSEYVVKGATTWVDGWAKNGWITGGGTPVKNQDLWERLIILRDLHNVRFDWVKGHDGNPFNEQCDYLCGLMKKSMLKQLTLNADLVPSDPFSNYDPNTPPKNVKVYVKNPDLSWLAK